VEANGQKRISIVIIFPKIRNRGMMDEHEEDARQENRGMMDDHVEDARQESRAQFKEWREVRTSMAQARLAELEERLNRLQLKTSMLKTKPDEPIGIIPDDWALPGTVDERHSNIMSSTADNPATVRPQKRYVTALLSFLPMI